MKLKRLVYIPSFSFFFLFFSFFFFFHLLACLIAYKKENV